MTLGPGIRSRVPDQDDVPAAGPLPPVPAFDQVTLVTPTSSVAVPPRLTVADDVLQVVAFVGTVIEILGDALGNVVADLTRLDVPYVVVVVPLYA
jgi:hypothetical protein